MSNDGLQTVTPLAGPLLLAYCFSFGLYGVFVTQVYAYYICFPKDKVHVKIIVYSVLAIETGQTILIIRDAIATFGFGFGQQGALIFVHNEWLTMPIVSGIIGCIVQCFYAYRIKRLTHTNAAPCFIALLAFVQCTGAIVAGIEGHSIDNMLKLNTRVEYVSQVVRNVTSAVCDLVIAVYIIYHLTNSQTRLNSTKTVLTSIIRSIIGTGLFTAMVAVLDLALYLADYKDAAYFVVPCLCLGKLYSNSMLVLLNNRANIKGGRGRDIFGEPVEDEYPIDFGNDTFVATTSRNSGTSSSDITA